MGGQAQDKEARQQQDAPEDSLIRKLESVVIMAGAEAGQEWESRPVAPLDRQLEQAPEVNMIRRGAYAWESMLNGMASERSVITVDGMRVYGACTDKMDPITSYVETTNLSRATIKSGATGSGHGATVAGAIDLQRRRAGFGDKPEMKGSVFTGFETNNRERIAGATLSYSDSLYYGNLDATYRKAGNYSAGHREGMDREVRFSQFTKYNLSGIIGLKIHERGQIEASIIHDKATDVGYPGLPMDVSLAQATIAAVQYRYLPHHGLASLWETKVYYNTVTHVMDDSQRPDVPLHMDMPGWTKTVGMYSKVYLDKGRHAGNVMFSGHRNNSLAEMTMYPVDPREPVMFMLTWPDVSTLYGGVQAEDRITLNQGLRLFLNAGAAWQNNQVESKTGERQLRLFHPDLDVSRTRFLPNVGTSLEWQKGKLVHRAGIGYSERAPSVSEAYGFYLLNANDNYDYVGDPNLRNERALSAEWKMTFRNDRLRMEWSANYFNLFDYIIGKIEPGAFPMNMTATGTKVYRQLPNAHLFNTGFSARAGLGGPWTARAEASYRHGQGAEATRLPLIQPLQYGAGLEFDRKGFHAEAGVEGSSTNRPSAEFGETRKPAYAILNLAVGKDFTLGKSKLTVDLGVDNLMDQYYTTFSDWFGIPRPGRNVFVHLVYAL